MNQIIITDCDHSNMLQEQKVISEAGMEYTFLQCKTEEDLIEQCKGGVVMINQYAPFTRKAIEALTPELKLIVRYGVGVDNVNMDAATDNGVLVCNVPDYGMNEVADQAAAMALAMLRKLPQMVAYTKKEGWNYGKSIPIRRIGEITVGIVGIGRIGRTFAKRMKAFDCKVIAYDSLVDPGQEVEGIQMVDFDTLVAESDLISIHCPLTPESRDLFNGETFKNMKASAYLVNTARGGIVNEADLKVALEQGEIAAAALDVVEKEPLSTDNPLMELDNFLVTPHMGWYSEEAAAELKRKVAEEAVNYINGKDLRYALNAVK